jgi:hypothetical protein
VTGVEKLATQTAKTNDKPTSIACRPYTQTAYGQLSRMLAKHNIKSITLPPKKISSYLPLVKDAVGLITPAMYSILCECGRVYIGQCVRPIQI